MYIMSYFSHLIESNHLEISIKHSFTSSDFRLLYFASACFLSLPFDFFHFRSIFSRLLAFVCLRLRPFSLRLRPFAFRLRPSNPVLRDSNFWPRKLGSNAIWLLNFTK